MKKKDKIAVREEITEAIRHLTSALMAMPDNKTSLDRVIANDIYNARAVAFSALELTVKGKTNMWK